jgi:REP-associated tyrosine transposase
MARPLRLERPGGWYHVTVRGVERRAIFRDDRDRRRLLELLGAAVSRFRWLAHGYVLMDNHYHLIIQIQETNLSRGMQWFQTSYSMGFNRRHGRVGPLVQGRFKAVVVDPVGWALELSRYVHLNPVRTAPMGLDKRARKADRLGVRGRPNAKQVRERVQRLRNYRWSSYRAYVGLDQASEWLTCKVVLELGGPGTLRQRQAAYARYVEAAVREGLEQSPWEHLEGKLILGPRRFVEDLRKRMGSLNREHSQRRALSPRPRWEQVLQAVESVRGQKWEEFRDRHGDWGRELALYLGRQEAALSLRQLGARAGGADYAAVSVAIKRFERRLSRHKVLRHAVAQTKQLLNVET